MPKIRVLVVDDAVVMRRFISEVLTRDPSIEVVGTASSGRIALQRIPQINPDIITLDVEMPELDGLGTLREIRKVHPTLPVIMFSTLTARGAVTTLDALSLGASDYVTKPANVGSIMEGMSKLETELIPKIKVHCRHLVPVAAPPQVVRTPQKQSIAPGLCPQPARAPKVEIICMGTSTGGPNALAEVFRQFPGDIGVPIVIVQHMPPMFTALLAERLCHVSPIRFHEGAKGQVLEPGNAYIAPGGRHMEIRRTAGQAVIELSDAPPENSCRPAVDVLFRSVATSFGGATLAVVMTGMGQDGMRGCQWLRERNAQILAQDEKTSVVWGMPGAVVHEHLADQVVPLNGIQGEIVRRVTRSREIPTPALH